jgi:hypothetical protein
MEKPEIRTILAYVYMGIIILVAIIFLAKSR